MVFAALLLGIACDIDSVSAQVTPREGPFTVNFTTIGVDQLQPVIIGDNREWGLSSSILTATNAEGRGLLHNLTGRCVGWYILDKASKSYEYHGHCNYTDSDGDIVYEKADFDSQPIASDHVGIGRWLGGTGKYTDLSGVFEIRVRPLRPARPGVTQAIGTKEGQYRLPPN